MIILGSPLYQGVEYKNKRQPQTEQQFKDSPGRSKNGQNVSIFINVCVIHVLFLVSV